MSSITGLGLRNKVGLGKTNESSPKPKQPGNSITGLGLRNKAAGLTGKKGHDQAAPEHVVTPRSALIDPSSFAPPPKNVNYHGTAADERQANRISQKGPLTPAEYQAREKEKADRQREEESREKEARRLDREAKQSLRSAQQGRDDAYGPRLPYRDDTAGLSTAQFAPPVARGCAADGTRMVRATAPSKAKAKPPLPPRLPSRQNASPMSGGLNSQGQSPMQRPQLPARVGTGSSPHSLSTPSDDPRLGESRSRFAKAEAQTQGSMWAGQGALGTTSSLRDAPAKTSIVDGRNFASTSNNLRKGHGEEIAKGWKPVDTSNRIYGLRSNVTSHSSSTQKNFEQSEEVESSVELNDNTDLLVKKAPPPRPKKKAALAGIRTQINEVPPHFV